MVPNQQENQEHDQEEAKNNLTRALVKRTW